MSVNTALLVLEVTRILGLRHHGDRSDGSTAELVFHAVHIQRRTNPAHTKRIWFLCRMHGTLAVETSKTLRNGDQITVTATIAGTGSRSEAEEQPVVLNVKQIANHMVEPEEATTNASGAG